MTLADGNHAPKTNPEWLSMEDAISDSFIEADDDDEDDGEGVLADDQMARLMALLQVCKMAGTTGPFRYRSSLELIRLSHWVMTGDPHMVEAQG